MFAVPRTRGSASLPRYVAFLLALPILFLAARTSAADWPQFRGLRRDGHAPETGLLRAWPAEGLKPLWVAEGLGAGFSSATIADGNVYVSGMPDGATQGVLFCFDAQGKLQWRSTYGEEYTQTYPGPRGALTVSGTRGFLMTGLGTVVCFDLAAHRVLWTRDVAKDFKGPAPKMGFNESLLVTGGKVICTPGGPQASVVALDATTGKTRWASKDSSDMSAYCSPMLLERGGTKLVVTLTALHLLALDPASGAVVWSVPFDEQEADQNHAIMPLYADGLLYVTSGHRKGGQCYALSPDGRKAVLQWSDITLNTSHGGLVAVGGYLYGSNSKGDWTCLSMADGAVRWQDRGVGAGSVSYADGMLYCYGEKGTIALVKASPEHYECAGSFKIAQGTAQHWPHPAIASGQLYIRHGDVLLAFDIRTP